MSILTNHHTSVVFDKKPPAAQVDLKDPSLTWTPTGLTENDPNIGQQHGFKTWKTAVVNTAVEDNKRIVPNDASKVFTSAQLNADHAWRTVVRNDHNVAETDVWMHILQSGVAGIQLLASPPSDKRLRINAMAGGNFNIPGTGVLGNYYEIVGRNTAASNLYQIFVNGDKTSIGITTTQVFTANPSIVLMNVAGFTQGPDGGIAEFDTWTGLISDGDIKNELTGAKFDGNKFVKSRSKLFSLGLFS